MHDDQPESAAATDRRSLLGRVFTWLGLGGLGMSLASTVYANFRFFFPKVLYEPPAQFQAGFPAEYQQGVSDRWAKEHQVWVIRDNDKLYALLTICTHLGCLTGFFPAESLFKCPCHGSNFSLEGDPVAGPAPVPLYHLALSIGADGQIIVDKNRRENRPGSRDEPPYVLKVSRMPLEKLARSIKQSQLWRSFFRHGPPTTPRTRSQTVVSNFFLHLHPVTVPRRALQLSFTWGLGGIALLLFMILVVTGILLTFYYVPHVDRAYESMKDLQFAVPFGMFLRNVHRWSAHAMVLIVILHMARVFYTGSYRPPREFNWMLGVFLMVITLLLSFTGYLLPWDQLAYWAVTVGTNMAASTPLIGHTGPFHQLTGASIDNDIRFALLGGTSVGQNALSRFYVLHCMALPLLFSVLAAIHFWRIRKDGGISRRSLPAAGVAASPTSASTASTVSVAASPASKEAPKDPGARYRLLAYVKGDTFSGKRDLPADEVQVWPHLVIREFLMALSVIIVIWMISIAFNAPLEEKANPAVTPNPAKAPWYFVGLQELLTYFDPWIAGVMIPSIIVFGLLAIPYLDVNRQGVGEYMFGQRKFAVSIFTFGAVFWFALIFIGLYMRGPSWGWYWPWEDWTVPKETVTTTHNVPAPWGALALAGYFGVGLLVPAVMLPGFRRRLGTGRYIVTMFLFLLMIAVPAKIVLRLVFDTKYLVATPWFNI